MHFVIAKTLAGNGIAYLCTKGMDSKSVLSLSLYCCMRAVSDVFKQLVSVSSIEAEGRGMCGPLTLRTCRCWNFCLPVCDQNFELKRSRPC
eukprot:148167-Amphidinium_carterae.3